MKTYIAVIAYRKRDFDDFLYKCVEPEDRRQFRWIGEVDHIRGLRFSHIVRIGNYKDIQNYDELYHRCRIQQIKSEG